MKQDKRTQPARNKATLDKYLKKDAIDNIEIKKNLKKLKT